MQWFFPRSTGPVEQTHWRTYLVFAHTFWNSLKVVTSATRGSLSPEEVDESIQVWCRRVFGVSHTALGAAGLDHVDGSASVLLSNQFRITSPTDAADRCGRSRCGRCRTARQPSTATKARGFGPRPASSWISAKAACPACC